ncbi:hypothetical protein [Vagococcus fluvialis]|uniref:hypothetical protein n=1 Tax=Vagococcus fluvialis TaxID=2738 RepID=UPI003B5A3F53
MLYFDSDKSRQTVVDSVAKYEKHFKVDFPTFEYIESESVTVEVADKLKKLIDNCVKSDKLVATPKDYDKRLY